MVFFKSCPRCQGDMHINRDMYGEYKKCLQCGSMVDIDDQQGVLAAALAKAKTPKKRSTVAKVA